MAFCRYCGKQLAEGEVCTCQQAASAQAPQQAAPQQAAPQQAAPQQAPYQAPQQPYQQAAPGQFSQAAGSLMTEVKALFQMPAQYAETFIRKANMIHALILILIQAVCAGFFALTLSGSANELLGLAGGFGSAADALKISGAAAFFLTVLYSVLMSAILAAAYFAVVKIMSGDLDIKMSLCAASIRAVYLAPLFLVSILLFFISKPLGAAVFYVVGAVITGYVFLLACKAIKAQNPNKLFYVAMIMFVVFVLVTEFLGGKLLLKTYLPQALRTGMNFMSMLG